MKTRHDRIIPDILPENAPEFVEDQTEQEAKTYRLLLAMFPDSPFLPLVYALVRGGGVPVRIKEIIWTVYEEPDSLKARHRLEKDLIRLRARCVRQNIQFRVHVDETADTLQLREGDPRLDQKKYYRDNIPNILRDYHNLQKKHPELSLTRSAHVLKVPMSTLRLWLRREREGRIGDYSETLRRRGIKAAAERERRKLARR